MNQQKIVIAINGKNLHPRELTLKEIEQVLLALRSDEIHPVETICGDIPVSALAIATSCDIEVDELMDLTPTEVRDLAGQVRDINPSLAREIEQLAALAVPLLKDESAVALKGATEDPSTASSTVSVDPVAG